MVLRRAQWDTTIGDNGEEVGGPDVDLLLELLADLPPPPGSPPADKHWCQVLLTSPDFAESVFVFVDTEERTSCYIAFNHRIHTETLVWLLPATSLNKLLPVFAYAIRYIKEAGIPEKYGVMTVPYTRMGIANTLQQANRFASAFPTGTVYVEELSDGRAMVVYEPDPADELDPAGTGQRLSDWVWENWQSPVVGPGP